MTTNSSPKKLAYKILRENGISKPTLDNLIYIINLYGFDIIDFDENDPSKGISTIIDNLNLHQLFISNKAFSYKSGDVKLVFVNDSLTSEEKCCVLAHELGHIILNHLTAGSISPDIIEEYQANEFAHYLLNPSPLRVVIQSIRIHKKICITTVVIVAILGLSIIGIQNLNKQNSYHCEYYITQSGEKYHEKDCICVKDKKNVHRMTEKEFDSGAYEPCQICLPNSSNSN